MLNINIFVGIFDGNALFIWALLLMKESWEQKKKKQNSDGKVNHFRKKNINQND